MQWPTSLCGKSTYNAITITTALKLNTNINLSNIMVIATLSVFDEDTILL